ncbi:MAG: beta-lactamase family protein [Chloroflexi bacterium]|nr:beta-lactamase family protein [Chloroflexota bacterium]MCA2002364.1 beta-lactamase family protein [Chloroflexota bacterium]
MKPNNLKNAKFAKAAQKMASEMERLSIPGAAIGVYHQSREFAAGFGVTSVENPLPVTPDTLFQIGSITKTFTGTALMQLAEQGKIDLDAPVRKYIKDLKLRDEDTARRVTTRHLLTHSGGWVGDYFNNFGDGDDALARMVKDIAKLPQVTPLGKIWSYNNVGFNIAARTLEVVARKPYEKAIQDALLDPLNMKATFFYPNDILMTHRFVVGHYQKGKKTLVARPWAIGRAGNGVGGAVSSVKDLLAYARFHMGDGGGIAARETLEAMRIPQISMGRRGEMGITWFISPASPLRYSHGGATHGQQAFFMFIPEKDFAFCVLTNSDNGGVLNANVAEFVLDLYCNIKTETPKPYTLSAAELREFTGSYRIGTEAFELKARDGMLIYHPIPLGGFPTPDTPPGPAHRPVRMAFYEKDQTVALDEPMKNALGDFIRNEKGRVEFFRIGGRAHKKIK